MIDDRIFLNGNKLMFIEPLEANSNPAYIRATNTYLSYLKGGLSKKYIHGEIYSYVLKIQNYLLWLYQTGSKYNTPFWDYAKEISYDRLNNDLRWQNQISEIQMIKRQNYYQMRHHGVGAFPVKSWVDFDDNLNYNLF